MANAYSIELRERVVHAYRRGDGTLDGVARTFSVNPRTVQRWLAHERVTGSLVPKPKAGGWRCPITLPLLHAVIADAPDATIAELCWEYNRRAAATAQTTVTSFGRAMRREGYVLKKRPRPSEIDRPDVRAKRATFMKWMRRVDPDRLVFLDEAGANLAMGRSHAWVLRGHEYVEPRPMNWGDNLTLVGAIRRRGWVALGTVWRAMNAKRFLAWVRRALVPRLWPGAIVVLDNLAAHKQPAVRAAIRRAGARVKFLPPYSHDFNPIESAWALVKKHIKAWAPRTGVALRRVARAGRHQVRPHHCARWFTHAGYGCSSTFRG